MSAKNKFCVLVKVPGTKLDLWKVVHCSGTKAKAESKRKQLKERFSRSACRIAELDVAKSSRKN